MVGQIGILLLVVLGLVISLVLSIASRSMTDLTASRHDREGGVAFTMAETGIEQALLTISEGSIPPGTVSFSEGAYATSYSVSGAGNFDLYVKEGDLAELNLTDWGGTEVTIKWTLSAVPGENPGCISEGSGKAPAALEVFSLIDTAGTKSVQREYYNGYNCVLSNGFGASLTGAPTYLSRVVYTVPAGTTHLRVRPIYSGATIVVEGAGLTGQLYVIKSSAVGVDSQKDIEVKRTNESAGSVFDYALFSGSTIAK